MFRLDEIIDAATAKLLAAIKAKEPAVLERLLDYIARMDSKGGDFVLSAMNDNAVALLERYVKSVLHDLHWEEDVADFIAGGYDSAAAYAVGLHKELNGIVVPQSILVKWRQYAVNATIQNLIGAGLASSFSASIKKILADAVYGGGSLTDVLKQVREYAKTTPQRKGALLRHVTQVSRDAVGQYAGNVHRIIAKKYELDRLDYVGGLVKDSRPQCIRWVGMEKILIKDLNAEIEWAQRNGSGLIPGTNADNFIVNRGGYNCIHEAIPTRS